MKADEVLGWVVVAMGGMVVLLMGAMLWVVVKILLGWGIGCLGNS